MIRRLFSAMLSITRSKTVNIVDPGEGVAGSDHTVTDSEAVSESETVLLADTDISIGTDEDLGTKYVQIKRVRDRALVAVEMLLHTLRSEIHTQQFDTAVLIILQAPAQWISPISEARLQSLLGADTTVDQDFDQDNEPEDYRGSLRSTSVRRRLLYTNSEKFALILCPDEEPTGSYPSDLRDKNTGPQEQKLIETVSNAIASGKATIILATSIQNQVPDILQRAADHILFLPALDDVWLANFIAKITGDHSPLIIPQMDYEGLRPAMLQLAARTGQTSADYIRRLSGLMGHDQNNDERDNTKRLKANPKPRLVIELADLHGMVEFTAWAKDLAKDIDDFKAGKLSWADVDPAALLYGPPGCGKTTAAKAIAKFCKIPLIATSYADWQSRQEGHLGDLLRAMREVFQKARDLAPCILFIDELDSINSRGSSIRNEDWWRAVINALLAELDGIDPREGVVIIGATNYPQSIDPAIRRAGRMDREILISLPDVAALVKIFTLHLGDALETSLRESSDEAFKASDLRRLAELSVGRSGADIAKICRGSKRRARTARRALTFNDVYAEIGGELSDPNDPIAQRSAIYEASRAVILARLYPGLATAAAIGGGGKLSGHALFSVDALAAPTARGIENLLVVVLAGRAGEDIIYGEISASAGGSSGSDLARATRLAVFMDASLGLGKGGGIWSEVGDSNDIDRYFAANPGGRIAVSARLSMAYERAKKIVTGDRTAVSLIAQALLHRNVLMAEEVGQILKEGERIPEPELEDMLLTETRH